MCGAEYAECGRSRPVPLLVAFASVSVAGRGESRQLVHQPSSPERPCRRASASGPRTSVRRGRVGGVRQLSSGRGWALGLGVAKREGQKNKLYVEECKAIGIDFFPFVLGAHGGFGSEAKRLWSLLVAQAEKRVDSDWRHSWTASSYSTTWKQKLSVALATQIAIGAQCRAPLLTRQRAMGEGVDVEGGEVQGRVYEGVAEGRAPSGMSV